MIRNTAYSHLQSRKSEQERVQLYFSTNQPAAENALDQLMQQEWKAFITSRAMDTLREKFAAQSIQVFETSLKGVPHDELAATYQLKRNTINRTVNRVKERLIVEIARLRKELE